jgi:Putative peptidoglycan binding domain
MITVRSAMMAGVIALSCVGIAQPADAQMRGGFSGGHFQGHGGFDHRGFGGNQFFFGFGFPGYGFGGYPYYPAYYYPPYPYYPYYPPYAASYAGYPAPASPGATSAIDPATVREIQAELQRRGYNVGPVDGRLGPRTKTAIREYEQRNGLPADGSPSPSLRNHMRSHPTG